MKEVKEGGTRIHAKRERRTHPERGESSYPTAIASVHEEEEERAPLSMVVNII